MMPEPVAVPMLVVDNKPKVRPLVFLVTRWDSTSSAVKQQVLVQWTGLAQKTPHGRTGLT